MEEVNKNTEFNDTDKKLHISDVSCRICGNQTFKNWNILYGKELIKDDEFLHKSYRNIYTKVKECCNCRSLTDTKERFTI
jgi:hypothetical protein